MDQNSPIQTDASPQDFSTDQINTTQTQFSWKYVSLGLILLIIAVVVSVGSYYLGKKNSSVSQISVDNNTAPTPIPTATEVKDTTELTDLSYAYINGTLYMKYKDKIYEKKSNYDPEIASVPSNVTWISLPVMRPISDDDSGYHGLFDFKSFSKNTFVFIMRWEGDSYVYYYDESNKPTPIKEVTVFQNKTNGYNVPKVYLTKEAINKDGKLIVLDMFSCWNCGGHVPETAIVELATGKIQNIGKISALNWLEGTKYQYKLSELIPCGPNVPQDQCYEANEKPENLSYIQGQFE